MALLHVLVGIFHIPVAHAKTLGEILSGQNMGVGTMWTTFMGLFPLGSAHGIQAVAKMFENVQAIILGGIGGAGVTLLAYAGARLAMTGWNEEGITKAKSVAKNVIIGLICALLADALILSVLAFLKAVLS